MPQNPQQTLAANPTQSKLNITAAAVVKGSPGHIGKIIVIAPGTTSGALTLNDNTITGGTNVAANEIISIAFGGLTAGQVIDLGNWPCKNGIVVSAVPGAGSPVFAISFT